MFNIDIPLIIRIVIANYVSSTGRTFLFFYDKDPPQGMGQWDHP